MTGGIFRWWDAADLIGGMSRILNNIAAAKAVHRELHS